VKADRELEFLERLPVTPVALLRYGLSCRCQPGWRWSMPGGSWASHLHLQSLYLYPPRIRGLEKNGQGFFVDLFRERA
jgi:hypothetical protein